MNQTQAKHTPGPWECSLDLCTVYGRKGWSIGPVGVTAAVCGDTPSRQEQEANARLIAAAPELLTAMEECITEPNAYCYTHSAGVVGQAKDMERRLKQINYVARAAIAKAKGGSNV